MSPTADERAKGVDLPDWWLEKVRDLVEERGDNLRELGVALANAVGRYEAWDHSSVSRFLRNKNTTVPMAEAFSVLLGIPRPFFVPRSMDEALSLQQVTKRHDDKLLGTTQQRRMAVLDQVAAAAEEEVADQTHRVTSKDEGESRRGRTGRPSRGRSPTS